MRDTTHAPKGAPTATTGAAASQVLNSATELEGQAGALKARVDAFLDHIREA